MTADEFNALHKVGESVVFQFCEGLDRYLSTKIRRKAWDLLSGVTLVSIEGVSGAVPVELIRPEVSHSDEA